MNPVEAASLTDQSGMAMMREYAGIARRNKWLIMGCVSLSVALAWGYCVIAPKYYRSESLIVVEEQKPIETVILQEQIGNFDQTLFLIQRQIVGREFVDEIAVELDLYPEGLKEDDAALAHLEMAKNIKVERIKTEQGGNFSGRSMVEAFTVSFLHQDPGTAMQVTARIAEKFIEENTKDRESALEGTSEFLDEELSRIKRELESREERISHFKRTHIGNLPQQSDANLRMLDRLETEISAARENHQRHSDRLAMLEKAVQEYQLYGRQSPLIKTTVSMEPDPLFRRLKELREQLVKLKAEFWDGYPEIIVTKEEMKNVEQELTALYGPEVIRPDKTPLDPYAQDLMKLQSEEKSELNLVKQRLDMLLANKKDLENRLERSPEVEQELLVLERDYDNMKATYAMLLDKRLHTRLEENLEKRQDRGKFRILDPANFPRAPAIPNVPRVMVLGLLFGCVVGAGLAVMRDRSIVQFRGPEDVELLLGPQLLATIPDFSFLYSSPKGLRYFPGSYSKKQSARDGQGYLIKAKAQQGSYPRNGYDIDRRFVAKLFPRSLATEQYRVAAARLQVLNARPRPTVVTVTSAIKGEGKTTTVINLGYTLARDLGKKVLLIDCDLVFPELSRFTENPIKYGLVDCLKGDIPIEEAMTSFADVPCSIMPAGESEIDSNELLKADHIEGFLSRLREQFDYILLNAPPILPVATMNVLERHTDLLLLVVRANLTSQQAVKRALSSLRLSKPVHVILNGVPMQALPTYMIDYSVLGSRIPV